MVPAWIVAVVGGVSAFVNPRGAWTWPPDVVTISEAVATGNYAEVVRQSELGVDPNRPTSIRADMLTREATELTPLQAAVLGRNALMFRILLDQGAIVLPQTYAFLACANLKYPNEEITESLSRFAPADPPDCSTVTFPK
jgi:hypothetical protein